MKYTIINDDPVFKTINVQCHTFAAYLMIKAVLGDDKQLEKVAQQWLEE